MNIREEVEMETKLRSMDTISVMVYIVGVPIIKAKY